MFKKFFILFLACFFVATIKTSATSQADSKYQTVKTVKARKTVKNNAKTRKTNNRQKQNKQYAFVATGGTSRNRTVSSNRSNVKRNTTRTVNRRNKSNTSKPKTTNSTNQKGTNFYAVAAEKESKKTTEISTANKQQESNNNNGNVVIMPTHDNSYYKPDNMIISMMDEQEKKYKNKQEGKITDAKPVEKKSRFRDRFYSKTRVYASYEFNSFKSPIFDNFLQAEKNLLNYQLSSKYAITPEITYNNLKKTNSISIGIENRLYFKFNIMFSMFGGIDLKLNNPFDKKNPNFSVKYSFLSLEKDGNVYTSDETMRMRADNLLNITQYGSLNAKIGLNINIFKQSILQIASYGLVGVNLIKITNKNPIIKGSWVKHWMPQNYWLTEVQSAELKKNNIGITFGGGIEIVVNNTFFIGAEYIYSINKAKGVMTPDAVVIDNIAYSSHLEHLQTVEGFGEFNDKIKTQTIVCKFGVQF